MRSEIYIFKKDEYKIKKNWKSLFQLKCLWAFPSAWVLPWTEQDWREICGGQDGMTAIHLAAKHGHINILDVLKGYISWKSSSQKVVNIGVQIKIFLSRSLFVCLAFSLSVLFLCLCLTVCFPVSVSVSVSLFLSLCVSVCHCLSLCLCLSLSLCLSLFLSLIWRGECLPLTRLACMHLRCCCI